jgi:phosphoglucosamine mutase
MSVSFGTDGIRGRAGEHPITPEIAVAVGRAAVRLGARRVLVARDPRDAGPMLEAGVAAGIAGEGAEALIAGVLPTSGVAAALAAGLADVGVMITASHNPPEDDGFKILGRGGKKLTDAETSACEAAIAEGARPATPGRLLGAEREAFDAYVVALEAATPERAQLAGPKIAIDLANGAGIALVGWLLDALPGVTLVGEGTGRPNDGVGSEHPAALGAVIRERGLAGGFAIDGDGDRCRLVDASGALVDGDAVAWLLARGRHAEAIAVTVMSTTALEPALPGVRVMRTPVGDRHLGAAMDADPKIGVGAEESGHVLFADALPTGDGIVTGIRALALALAAGGIAESLAGFRPFPRKITKVRVVRRRSLADLPALADAAAAGELLLGANGRVFLRYSGTEPVLRVLVEGADADVVSRVSADVTALASRELA